MVAGSVKASSIVQSIANALRYSICPFVVSKWELPGTRLLLLPELKKEHFLQLFPGGWKKKIKPCDIEDSFLHLVIRRSTCVTFIAKHHLRPLLSLIAPVPESVRRSIKTVHSSGGKDYTSRLWSISDVLLRYSSGWSQPFWSGKIQKKEVP